jgi:hypothetical protein
LASDPYNTQFSKTDASAMGGLLKNGGLDFDTFKEPEAKISSPRSPVGRTDKRSQKSTTSLKPEMKKEQPKEKVA